MTTPTTPAILDTVGKLLANGLIAESDLTSLVNDKLADSGLALADAPNVHKRKARPAKTPKAKAAKRERSVTEYPDGRTNKHAILLAVESFGEDGCQSGDLRAKLVEINHEMSSAVFHTTRSNMQSKDKLLKSTGPARSKVFKLTAAGRKALEEFEAPAEPEAVEPTEETAE